MAVPKRKTSKSKNGMRQSNKGLKPASLSFDSNGDLHLPHHATLKDGVYYYKGRAILTKRRQKDNTESV